MSCKTLTIPAYMVFT